MVTGRPLTAGTIPNKPRAAKLVMLWPPQCSRIRIVCFLGLAVVSRSVSQGSGVSWTIWSGLVVLRKYLVERAYLLRAAGRGSRGLTWASQEVLQHLKVGVSRALPPVGLAAFALRGRRSGSLSLEHGMLARGARLLFGESAAFDWFAKATKP